MDRFANGIEAALPALRRFAVALTHERDLADDLVHDTVERALKKRRLWRPDAKIRPWLFSIMINILRNQKRAGGRRPETVTWDDLHGEPVSLPRQHDHLVLSELATKMEQLPTVQRQVLLLVAVEGFSYMQCAKILKVPPGTVMSRLARARATLRETSGKLSPTKLRRVK